MARFLVLVVHELLGAPEESRATPFLVLMLVEGPSLMHTLFFMQAVTFPLGLVALCLLLNPRLDGV